MNLLPVLFVFCYHSVVGSLSGEKGSMFAGRVG